MKYIVIGIGMLLAGWLVSRLFVQNDPIADYCRDFPNECYMTQKDGQQVVCMIKEKTCYLASSVKVERRWQKTEHPPLGEDWVFDHLGW